MTQKAAAECGLSAKTPVAMGGGAMQMGSAGLGVVRENECAVLGGTFWQQVINIKSGVVDPSMNLRINPHVRDSRKRRVSTFLGL